MRKRIVLVAALGLIVAAADVACSSFTGDESVDSDGGSPDAPAAREDASMPATDAADAGDAADGADAADAWITPLVHVTGTGGSFGIEAHEVTVAQYNFFKSQLPTPLTFPAAQCPSKNALGPPAGHCGSRYANEDPITCIDWCDANAYCKGIGRHLCGNINGSALASSSRNDPGVDEWYYACRGPNALTYPYGDAGMSGVCATDKGNGGQTVNVASMPGCVGAEMGLYDMVGNAAEWVDSCIPGACLVRGGSYAYGFKDANCDGTSLAQPPIGAYADVGFRCCSETP